jgi:hypothetical protein
MPSISAVPSSEEFQVNSLNRVEHSTRKTQTYNESISSIKSDVSVVSKVSSRRTSTPVRSNGSSSNDFDSQYESKTIMDLIFKDPRFETLVKTIQSELSVRPTLCPLKKHQYFRKTSNSSAEHSTVDSDFSVQSAEHARSIMKSNSDQESEQDICDEAEVADGVPYSGATVENDDLGKKTGSARTNPCETVQKPKIFGLDQVLAVQNNVGMNQNAKFTDNLEFSGVGKINGQIQKQGFAWHDQSSVVQNNARINHDAEFIENQQFSGVGETGGQAKDSKHGVQDQLPIVRNNIDSNQHLKQPEKSMTIDQACDSGLKNKTEANQTTENLKSSQTLCRNYPSAVRQYFGTVEYPDVRTSKIIDCLKSFQILRGMKNSITLKTIYALVPAQMSEEFENPNTSRMIDLVLSAQISNGFKLSKTS